VVGNPPYVSVVNIPETERDYFPPSLWELPRPIDVYLLFAFRALRLRVWVAELA